MPSVTRGTSPSALRIREIAASVSSRRSQCAVRVGHAERGDRRAAHLDRSGGVVEVEPAEPLERPLEACRVEPLDVAGRRELRRPAEVAQRVLQHRPVHVVRAVHEEPGHALEHAQRIRQGRQGGAVPEAVARVDDEVGLERREPLEPVELRALPGGEVDVGEVQHGDRACADGQHAQLLGADAEGARLDGGRVGGDGGAGGEHAAGDRADRPGASSQGRPRWRSCRPRPRSDRPVRPPSRAAGSARARGTGSPRRSPATRPAGWRGRTRPRTAWPSRR